MLGGKPIKSRLTRRINVTRSASGDGLIFSFSSRAKIKLSIGLRAQFFCFTDGTGTFFGGGTNDQCKMDSAFSSDGDFAPSSIHFFNSAIFSSSSGVFLKGIRGKSFAVPETALIK